MREKRFRYDSLALAVLLAHSAWGCEEDDLHSLATSESFVRVEGEACAPIIPGTEPRFKVLFAVDTSGSMQFTDPDGHRARALRAAIDKVLEYRFSDVAVVTFAGASSVVTLDPRADASAFTRDRALLERAIEAAGAADGVSDQQGALQTIASVLADDLRRIAPEERGRTMYSVKFLVDGPPYPTCCSDESQRQGLCSREGELPLCGGLDYNQRSSLVQGARDIVGLGPTFGTVIGLHTFFLFDPELAGSAEEDGCHTLGPLERICPEEVAETLLRVAQAGEGSYRSVWGESMDLWPYEWARPQGHGKIDVIVVTTPGLRLEKEGLMPDSDQDGLSDVREAELGSDPLLIDTDGDGYSDLLEARVTGLDPTRPDEGCDPSTRVDVDGDGLSICEEVRLGTADWSVDSDDDGMFDALEVRVGTDPARADPDGDLDGDGRTNWIEVVTGLRPDLDEGSDEAARALANQFDIRVDPERESCLGFEAQHVLVSPTGQSSIRVWALGHAIYDVGNFDTIRTACRTLEPEDLGGLVTFTLDDFSRGASCP